MLQGNLMVFQDTMRILEQGYYEYHRLSICAMA